MTQSESIRKRLVSEKIKSRFLSSGISHVSLFGSYARNEATEGSDLDLLVELSDGNRVTFQTLEELQEFLQGEFHVRKVDFVTKRKLNPYLKPYVEKDIVPVF